jgi:hypothetical protein
VSVGPVIHSRRMMGDEIADEPPCVDDVVVGAGEVVKWGGEAEDGKVGHTEELLEFGASFYAPLFDSIITYHVLFLWNGENF